MPGLYVERLLFLIFKFMSNPSAQIGIFGGSGFYDLLENTEEVEIDTKYGKPSAKVMIGEYKGKKVAFLPRHGSKHTFPPHKIPYLANIAAFKELGVKKILGPCATGSLQPNVKPGDFVICDQFVDRTRGRVDTFNEGPHVAHPSAADPYCAKLSKLAVKSCHDLQIPVHEGGTVVIINGPRFSTRSESRWFSSQGWEVINMTQYPECMLAREQEMCFCNISLITDYDVGLEGQGGIKPVDAQAVIRVFTENNEKLKKLIFKMLEEINPEEDCACHKAMGHAFVS